MRRAVPVLATIALLLVAGCGAPANVQPSETTESTATTSGGPESTTAATTTERPEPNHPPDPATDRIGWENGYWYNETLNVTPGDGFDEEERRKLLARTMARVERIRDLEFDRNVTVTVISREKYREQNVFEQRPDPFEDQVYEALFLVDEDTSVAESLNEVYGGSVAGYYANDRIVLVSNDPGGVEVDRGTLAHELVHALQDQNRLYPSRAGTTDGNLARTAVSEGEANYVMDRYEQRCGTEWNCIPPVEASGGERNYNVGLFLTLFVPYSEGPGLMATLRERGGWTAVTDLYDDPPESTEQVIHPERYPDDDPVDVEFEDRSSSEWSKVRTGGDRVGEALLYATFQHNDVIPDGHLRTAERRFNYSHPITTGWGGDVVVPYRNDDDEYGYVFKTVWDTERDAEQFHEAYLELLDERGAREVRDGVYRIPEDRSFADAFRVERDGRTVVITNAPSVEGLDGVREP